MRVELPYIVRRGSTIYYRRRARGGGEIKFALASVHRFSELLPELITLSRLSEGEIRKVRRKIDSEMMSGSWESILRTLHEDRPEGASPALAAVADAISGYFSAGETRGPSLREVIEMFLEERSASGISPSGLGAYRSILGEMAAVVGEDREFGRLQLSDVLPYRNMVSMNTALAKGTKMNKLVQVRTFFEWAFGCGHTAVTLAAALKGIRITEANSASTEENRSFSDADIRVIRRRLFPERQNVGASGSQNFDLRWRYWTFFVGLWQGMRAGEVCQLDTADIVSWTDPATGEEIPCILIDSSPDDKRVKNKSSKRLIPIHSALLADGFLSYVESRRKMGKEKLFELGRHPKNGYTQSAGRYFRETAFKELEDAGMLAAGYSLSDTRHTFETRLFHATSMDEKTAGCRLTGREIDLSAVGIKKATSSVMWKHYVTEDVPPSVMRPVLEKVRFQWEEP